MFLSYRNQSIDLLFKSIDWFLYDRGLRHERGDSLRDLIILKTLQLACILKLFLN